MDAALEKRTVKLKKSLKEMICPKHQAYKVAAFCTRKQCGFGFVCEACEELDHAPLQHHFLDGIGIDNRQPIDSFLASLFGEGLHYEERESLWPNCTTEELKKAKKHFRATRELLEKELQETDKLLEKCQKEVLAKLELRFSKLRKDVGEEVTKAFKLELRPLEYIIYAMENVSKKRNVSLQRLVTELEEARSEQLKGLDIEKCTLAVQGHLEGTYNYLDVDYMKDMRTVLAYFEANPAGSKVRVEKEALAQRINQNILHELGHLIVALGQCTKTEGAGLEGLILSKTYADNLATVYSTTVVEPLSTLVVDRRVKVGQGNPVTSLCKFAEKYIVVGHQNGTLRVFFPSSDVRAG